MKLYVVLGDNFHEGLDFYAVRRDRAEAEEDVRILDYARRSDLVAKQWRESRAQLKARFGRACSPSADHEIREVEVPGIVSTADSLTQAMVAAQNAHDAVVNAWDRERDLRASVPG